MYVNESDFYGRGDVVSALQGHLDAVLRDGRGRLIAVRGRRQVGKSTAVEHFARRADVPYVFTVGTQGATVRAQLEDATHAFAESTHPFPNTQVLRGLAFPGWREWFGVIEQAAASGPVVVVIDEFPWAAGADPSLEGTLQNTWDRRLEGLPVLTILIGSDVAMMEELSEYGRPLFGRIRPLMVDPLNPAEVAQALPDATAMEVFDAHLVTGGYPRLVSDLARSGRDASGYVHEAVQDAYSPLVSTARFTLDAEFPESQAAARMLAAIGADETTTPRFNDLIPPGLDPTESTRAQTATTRALRLLTDQKRIVVKEVPAWSPEKGRLRRYRVVDPYLRFWFRYIDRDIERILRGRADLVTARFDRDWPSWRGRSIEPVIRDALFRLSADDDSLNSIERVSAWWTRNGQREIDIAATDAERTVILGTIKWRAKGKVTTHELVDLAAARAQVPRAEGALLAAISPQGGDVDGADRVFSAADLLEAWSA